jgi:hypothetical protein
MHSQRRFKSFKPSCTPSRYIQRYSITTSQIQWALAFNSWKKILYTLADVLVGLEKIYYSQLGIQ